MRTQPMSMRILVVDDDDHLREVVRYALDRQGYTVTEARDGAQAVAMVRASAPDLVVMDVLMPELDGLEACRQLRAFSQVPVIFLSSRGEEIDKVLGLELGGDDYLAKPFSTRELVSRVKAVLRRVSPREPHVESEPTLTLGALSLSALTHRVHVGEDEVILTATEFRLLHAMLRQPGRVFSRADLLREAYEDAHHVSDRTLDSHVRGIRGKLREAGCEAIETVHGVGYRLVSP